VKISQELGLGEGLILGAGRPFDHLCRDADGDGVGRDVVINKAEGSNHCVLPNRYTRHDNTAAPHLAVLFQGHLSHPFRSVINKLKKQQRA
jgi:hypothetical protein